MAEHTPTPWVADPDDRHGYEWNIHILDKRGDRICFMTSDGPAEANAAYIVKAVKSHEMLVKVLEGIAEFSSGDDTTLGALHRLASIRNSALTILAHVSGSSTEANNG